MTKGTPSFGKHRKVTHARCRRCGSHSYHKTKKRCSKCGFPSAKLRKFRWQWKHPLTKKRKK